MRHVRDSVHELIPWSPRLSEFIDTPQFQRLRSIKQLGTSYYVWPGASHNRFEHCIGVANLARQMATHLKTNQPELGITDRDVECVELAGLCHDLGHGPWSHVWDGMFIPAALKGEKEWTHEQGSEAMLDYLISDNGIDIPVDDVKFIKAMIAGEPKKCRPNEKKYLFDIVSNKLNGLDVDKFDYIRRDQTMVGDQGNISLRRLIQSARVIDNQICYDAKDINLIYEVYNTRFRLHKMIYNHKTAKAIEYMIIDALLKAEPFLHIAERVFDPQKFMHLTDDIMPRIEADDNPNLAPAKAIFARIRKRNLYRCVDYKNIPWNLHAAFKEATTAEKIVEEVKQRRDEILATVRSGGPGTPLLAEAAVGNNAGEVDHEITDCQREDESIRTEAGMRDLLDQFQPEHVIVDFSPMHYGMKADNPLDFVKFYSKQNPTVCRHVGYGIASTLMPAVFGEVLMRVYVRESQFYGLAQSGFRAVTGKVYAAIDSPQNRALAPTYSSSSDAFTVVEPLTEPASPAADVPSTPPSHSRKPSYATLAASPGHPGSAKTPMGHNPFTSVHPSFAPKSPSVKPQRKGSEPSLLSLRSKAEVDSEGHLMGTQGPEAGAAVRGLGPPADIAVNDDHDAAKVIQGQGQGCTTTSEDVNVGVGDGGTDTVMDASPSPPKGTAKGRKRARGVKGGEDKDEAVGAGEEESTPRRRKSARRK